MALRKLLVANRGEIAVRVLHAAAEAGIETVAVFSEDDAASLHTRRAGAAVALKGAGPAAYLDIEQIILAAKEHGCDSIHPGYGFLSENARFAHYCAEDRLIFVGPTPAQLSLFGDKAAARAFAQKNGVPILEGTNKATSLADMRTFFAKLGPGGAIAIKAVAGGGGRGIRIVTRAEDVDAAFARCQSEAEAAFGNGDVYVERFLPRARHIEIQIVGDGTRQVAHLFERDCSIQRRQQKIVECAPSPVLPSRLRDAMTAAALRMAGEAKFLNLGTFEFLVDAGASASAPGFFFIEANPRLQVEHTVTEAVTGLDLVRLQLALAGGEKLETQKLADAVRAPRGFAIEARINMESMGPDGNVKPGGGTIAVFEPPSGPGIRVDSFAYAGYMPSPRFDSLLAKLIVHDGQGDFSACVAKLYRALCEFRIEGVTTNIGFLQNLVRHPDFAAGRIHTRFVDDEIAGLAAGHAHPQFYFPRGARDAVRRAGATLNSSDPLAVLDYGKSAAAGAQAAIDPNAPEGTICIRAPLQGAILSLAVSEGDSVHRGQTIAIMEAMKMEHVVAASASGIVRLIAAAKGDVLAEDSPILFLEESNVERGAGIGESAVDPAHIRADLKEVFDRRGITSDEARPSAVERRRKTGQRTARENIADLCDADSFVEYGPLVIAGQRRRRSVEDLIQNTPADGLVCGLASVNGTYFEPSRSQCAVLSYDYTVMAGTQGHMGHLKTDRLLDVAYHLRLPVIFFTEGGGGRPGDDGNFAGIRTFNQFARHSANAPIIAINSGYCFAGNAALVGGSDVIIATENSNIGMGGPAMIEGGGLGIFRPEEVGPMSVQVRNGVVDIVAKDEADAVRFAKQYLSYFQGPLADWSCADQRLLRHAIPENRLRAYDIHALIETLADAGSVLELRRAFGRTMVTALIRIEGRPMGLIANNPKYLGGAIDSDGGDKGARFVQLCDAFDLPILSLCDTPGIMVGPEAEKTALVRHSSRLLMAGANATVPMMSVILRKAYGIARVSMSAGEYITQPLFAVAWPTAEFGGMGLEGAVKLAYRKDIAAIEDPVKRQEFYDERVRYLYERGKAIRVATSFEIDDVIDPAETRRWIMAILKSVPPAAPRPSKKRPMIDPW